MSVNLLDYVIMRGRLFTGHNNINATVNDHIFFKKKKLLIKAF